MFEFQPVDNVEEGQPKGWMMEKPFVPDQEKCTGYQVCIRVTDKCDYSDADGCSDP